MNKITLVLMTFFLLILSSISVSAVGTCNLDKLTYVDGEIALFSCSCTVATEANIAGNIVWKKSDGSVLKITSSNSGTCTNNFFFDTFVFSSYANMTGNVTFATASSNWNSVGDIRFDNFILANPSPASCLIKELDITQNRSLGKLFSIHGKVFLASNQTHALGGISCNVEVTDTLNNLIVLEPYADQPFLFSVTNANGEFVLQKLLDGREWNINQNYLVEIRCFCPVREQKCYDLVTGVEQQVKSCSVSVPFTTGVDERINDTNLSIVGTMLLAIFIIFLLLYFSTLLGDEHNILKITILIFFVLFLLIFAGFVSHATINTSYETVGISLYKVLTIFSYILVAYIFLYFLFHVILLFYNSVQQKKRGGGS